MSKKKKRGRDAKTGRFITISEAKSRPNTTIIETIKPKRRKKS